MPRCEQCNRDFSTDEGLAQHNRDKHGIGKVTKHDLKEQKREEQEKQKKAEVKKQKSGKRLKSLGIIAVVALVIFGVGYFALSLTPSQSPSSSANYDLSGFPNSFVHWHADVDVVICGEDKRLPEAIVGALLGTNRLHTHDRATNINSLSGSDGNGVVHTEGNVREAPAEHTLGKFMRNIGVRFDNQTIMDKKNGDLCNGTVGTVKVFLNNQTLDDFLNYLSRDKDLIRIEFS